MSLERDKQNFERLLRPHLPKLYRLSCRLTASKIDADDLFQDVLARLFPRMQELGNQQHVATWLAGEMYNRFIDDQHRFSRQRSLAAEERSPHGNRVDSLSSTGDNLHDVVWREQMQTLGRALDMLNEAQRVTLLLHDAEAYKLTEIQRITGDSLVTIKSRLRQARARLREILPDDGTFL
ncbi:MAG: RNA polymerase sigma factor [Woeseia sp.]